MTSPECCMCGDHGLPDELFRCKRCQFRSQHRYCSNLYPKAEVYGVCNWCLNQEGEKMEGTLQNSPLSSSNSEVNVSEDGSRKKNSIKKIVGNDQVGLRINRSTSQLNLTNSSPTKKLKVSDQPTTGQKKVASAVSTSKESLRRTKSEDIASTRIVKQAFKGKVRRYKLLEEVSIR